MKESGHEMFLGLEFVECRAVRAICHDEYRWSRRGHIRADPHRNRPHATLTGSHTRSQRCMDGRRCGRARLMPKDELMEYICQENEQDAGHYSGPARLPTEGITEPLRKPD